tara:strand:+ start:216 stop:380 length:165 start_codon:yes stop_codon:yes gene_type:complete
MGGIIEEEAILRSKLSGLSDRSIAIGSYMQYVACAGVENRLSDRSGLAVDKSIE